MTVNSCSANIPLYPYFKLESIFPSNRYKYDIPSVLDSGDIYSTLNARSALEICLKNAGVKQEDTVLLPAYLCPVAVYAVTKLKIKPVFYQIGWDCTANIEDIRTKISEKTRAILAVHYFGFPANLDKIKTLCDQYNLLLIEDCAHCFFGTLSDCPVGGKGDFVIASFYKFFPSVHGGFLRVNSRDKLVDNVTVSPGGIWFQFKSAMDTLELGSETGKVNFIRRKTFQFKRVIWNAVKSVKGTNKSCGDGQTKADSINPYNARIIHDTYSDIELPLVSKIVHKVYNKALMIHTRRRNYHFLLEALRNIEGCRPLFETLPDFVVPYDFPLVSDEADKLTRELRERHVKVARFAGYLWDGIDKELCPVSFCYSQHCIQLPVHQSLGIDDMAYMIDIIKNVLGK